MWDTGAGYQNKGGTPIVAKMRGIMKEILGFSKELLPM